MTKNIEHSNIEKFNNRINVINADGIAVNPTYIRRARGLVKTGKAEWIDEKAIRIFRSPAQENKQSFLDFLLEKKARKAVIENCETLVEKLHLAHKYGTPSAAAIGEFIMDIEKSGVKGNGIGTGGGALKTAYDFLDAYTEYNGITTPINEAYREHIAYAFEEPAKAAVGCQKKSIVFIPEDVIIDPYFLDGFTNEEFVDTFRSFQHFIYSIYEEIENTSPLDWGWLCAGDIGAWGVSHNGVLDVLWSLLDNGQIDNNALVVEKEKFWLCHDVKSKVKPMIEGFSDMGLLIEGFDDKKSKTFTVSCPDTPRLFAFLKAYLKEQQRECCKCHMHEVYPCKEKCLQRVVCHQRNILSHRFFEKHPPEMHDTGTLMLAITDSAPPELAEILRYLHDEATRHGFKIQPWTVAHNGAINHWHYTDNWHMKTWLRVGSGTYWGDYFYKMQTGRWSVTPYQPAKPIFKNIFKKHPEKAEELMERFPDLSNIQNPTLEDVKFLLELYRLENNITTP
ncbi:MAG: hypothetical protein FWC95_02630 [Defluviitaleaceae bacterium]|nr:hypothetical protein [Defluviitaleaceae bacterium]